MYNNTNVGEKSELKSFADGLVAYGFMWSFEIKHDKKCKPTPEEMLVGLYKWLVDQL